MTPLLLHEVVVTLDRSDELFIDVILSPRQNKPCAHVVTLGLCVTLCAVVPAACQICCDYVHSATACRPLTNNVHNSTTLHITDHLCRIMPACIEDRLPVFGRRDCRGWRVLCRVLSRYEKQHWLPQLTSIVAERQKPKFVVQLTTVSLQLNTMQLHAHHKNATT